MNIVLFGKPGSGKGTLAQLLSKKYNLLHISTGDLLRDEIDKESELGLEIKNLMKSGDFVNDDIVENLMISFINSHKSIGYIFDGIPRNKNQCLRFEKIIRKLELKSFYYISLDCSDETSLLRMKNRAMNEVRLDANSSKNIIKKLEIYYEQTEKVIKHYNILGDLYQINSELSIENVYKSANSIIEIENIRRKNEGKN